MLDLPALAAPRAERDAILVRLGSASPLRPTTPQRASDDLPMFAAAAQPSLV